LAYSRPLAISAQVKVPGTTDEFFEGNRVISVAWLETLTGDIQKSVKDWTLAVDKPFWMGTEKLATALVATAYAVNHDPESARAVAGALPPDVDQSSLALAAINGFYPLPTYWIAVGGDDWSHALADARLSDDWLESHAATNKLLTPLRGVWIQPLEALALAHTGDIAGAEKMAAATPLDCYLCVRVRGQIAALKHDWPSAEQWFAEATRQAPSLPYAFSEWGEMRLAKGDFDAAITRFELAHKKTRQFADALKGWGDALARKGQAKAAVAKYDDALKYSPNWAALKQAHALVAKSI
jgi:tetratricopeptide (TPR) repeat protein